MSETRQLEKRPNLIIAELDRQRERKDGYLFNSLRRKAEERRIRALGRMLNIAWTRQS